MPSSDQAGPALAYYKRTPPVAHTLWTSNIRFVHAGAMLCMLAPCCACWRHAVHAVPCCACCAMLCHAGAMLCHADAVCACCCMLCCAVHVPCCVMLVPCCACCAVLVHADAVCACCAILCRAFAYCTCWGMLMRYVHAAPCCAVLYMLVQAVPCWCILCRTAHIFRHKTNVEKKSRKICLNFIGASQHSKQTYIGNFVYQGVALNTFGH